jgi:hypothetical protein
MVIVYEAAGVHRRSKLAEFETFEAAEAWVMSRNPIHYERDDDHAGCADAFMPGMVVWAIEAV